MNPTRSLRASCRIFQHTFRVHHAPFRILNECATSVPALRNHTAINTLHSPRHHSTEAEVKYRPLTDRETSSSETSESSPSATSYADEIALRKALSPAYQLWFTCKKCLERSGHTVSKQAYHYGTCVINCPKCKSQHLISDNLKIFSDTNRTMEDIALEYGEKLKKGRLGVDGDVEFYDEEADRMIQEGTEKKIQGELSRLKGVGNTEEG